MALAGIYQARSDANNQADFYYLTIYKSRMEGKTALETQKPKKSSEQDKRLHTVSHAIHRLGQNEPSATRSAATPDQVKQIAAKATVASIATGS